MFQRRRLTCSGSGWLTPRFAFVTANLPSPHDLNVTLGRMTTRFTAILVCLFPLSSLASEYAWLESNWKSDSGSNWSFEDGFITTYSCGSEFHTPYFILPISETKFDIIFHAGSTEYRFLLKKTEPGFCATFHPVWDVDNQTWGYSEGICFTHKNDSTEI